ncbi:vWA domain-containing protein [Yoonia sp.]|uniref:vWA domain-containing protein n=1 Tax=Yoonia sp. TaxID=2212373 RepID=UPI00391BC444
MKRLIPAFAALMLSAAPVMADRVAVLVFDASGSMWNRVEGETTRIEVARDVMADFFGSRDAAVPLSVIAYGHNRRGDCRDIEVINSMGQGDAQSLESRLRALMPRGMTPLTDSLAMARDQIPPSAEAADIILVTDGLENCEGDPCALAASLAAEGIDIRAHVVGFGLSAVEVEALSCITDQTGGMLFQTNSGAELANALQQVSAVMPEPAPEPTAAPETPAMLDHHFVFRDTGTGTPRGLMEWRAEAPDGTVIPLGTTEGTQQSLEGVSPSLPAGEWLIVAEGSEGRAERQMSLTQCCGSHGIPFVGSEMVSVIPPISQVQAGMAARLPYEITHPGTSHLGGTPYKIIATGPEGSLTRDQIVRDDLITSREPGMRGGATGELATGTYRLVVAVARSNRYDIIAEQSFEVVRDPAVNIVAPGYAQPFEEIQLSMDGGYATSYVFNLVDENDRDLLGGYALYYGPGGSLHAKLKMPDVEGVRDLVIRRAGEIIARKPITIGDTPPAPLVQDSLPTVPATFRLPPEVPQSDVRWDAVPLDADMSPEAWAPMDTGPVITGTFEPGNWRVTAYAPGEVTLSADVAIFPGQVNDFTVQINASDDEDSGAFGLEGQWRVLAVPPRDAPAGTPEEAMTMLDVTLETNSAGTAYTGRFTASAIMTGTQGTESALDSVQEEEGTLIIRLTDPGVSPEPFVIAVAPYGDGFSGRMASGPNAVPVIFWPTAMPLPDVADMQDQLYGPAPEDHGSLQPETVFTCAEFICSWTDPASGVTVPLPQGWSVTAPEFQTASATPVEMVNPSMSLFGPDGEALYLNPRQWLESNGNCYDTNDLGSLCHFADADIPTALTASMIAPLMERGQPVTGTQERPVSLTLPGVPGDAVYELEVTLVSGEDERHTSGQRFLGAMSMEDYALIVGNVYDIRATINGRDYRNRNVTVTPGNMAQTVTLAPVYQWDEVTMELPETPIVAGSGGFFPVTMTAPDGFQGTIAVHGAYDRDGPALFSVSGARLMGGQDQVLPVPDQPGFYEIRFLDINGDMFGGTEFEAITAAADANVIEVMPSGTTQFGAGCFISASLTGPEGDNYTMIAPVTASANGRELRSILDADAPLVFEIHSFGSTGQSIADLMLMAPCADITLDFETPECRFSVGDGIQTSDCPAEVNFLPMTLAEAGSHFTDAIVAEATEAANAEAIEPATPADPTFIEITPGDISTDQLLDLLLAPAQTE